MIQPNQFYSLRQKSESLKMTIISLMKELFWNMISINIEVDQIIINKVYLTNYLKNNQII